MQTTVISFRQANRKIDHLRQTKQESKCSSIKNKKLIDETIVYLKQPGADLELSQGGGGAGCLPFLGLQKFCLPVLGQPN